VVTSAGALVDGLKAIGAKKISLLAPYMKPLTALVVDYIESEGIEVVDSLSLEIPDNLQVGRCDPMAPEEITRRLNTRGVDAVVASACVQMPSLASIQPIEDRLGLPVVSSAVCTTWQMLKKLGLPAAAPGFGSLLSGRY
jgi:maleate isomerase